MPGSWLDTTATMTATASAALGRSLCQLADLLEGTSDDTYVHKPPGQASGAIGAHVRHILDHVKVLVDRPAFGNLTYDHRERDTAIEQDRRRGIEALRTAGDVVRAMDQPEDEALVLEALVERGQPPVAVATSLAREVVFALQHTIHHQAIIALLLHRDGVATPSRFGYAPATPTPRRA
jgi:uncharacterized damage-inducible protein DinB